MSGLRAWRRLLVVLLASGALVVISSAAVDGAQAVVTIGAPVIGETREPAATADEGLAVVGVDRHLLTRGHGSIPTQVRRLGWVHVGDPDAGPGYVVDAYQGTPRARAKAFAVTYADGRRVLLLHPLAAGESYHNSFAAVSPDGRWLVAGEWGTMTRLLVFALPAETAPATQPLTAVAFLPLTRPVRDVQGCDFDSPTHLLCSTNDNTTSLFPVARQLLSLRLDHVVDGTPDSARVRLVGSVPAQNVCAGPSGEVEGIDVTDGTVRIAVNSPCSSVTEIFAFSPAARWHATGDIDPRTIWVVAPPLVDVLLERRPLLRARSGR